MRMFESRLDYPHQHPDFDFDVDELSRRSLECPYLTVVASTTFCGSWQSVPVLNNTLTEEMPSNVETRSLDPKLHTVSSCTITIRL